MYSQSGTAPGLGEVPATTATSQRDRLGVSGQIHSAFRLGDTAVNVPFLVCDTFQAEALLGTQFIDDHVRDIHSEAQTLELKYGTEIPILRDERRHQEI